MVMQRWDPFGEMLGLRNAMDRLFDDSFGGTGGRGGGNNVGGFPIDVYEQGENLQIKASLPGIKPEDIKISVENNTVTIEGESRQDTGNGTARHQEHRYGRVMRSITLPSTVDASKAAANFEHGMLTLTLPRAESARARQIPVTQGRGQQTIPAQATPTQSTSAQSTTKQDGNTQASGAQSSAVQSGSTQPSGSSQSTAEQTTQQAISSQPTGGNGSTSKG